ncbi:MAG: hypothetical protein EHM36_00300, partial [Deltaproteobacteria bacterium]
MESICEYDNNYEISVEETRKLIQSGEQIALIDVREEEETEFGYLKGALFIPMDDLENKIEILVPDKNAPVVI